MMLNIFLNDEVNKRHLINISYNKGNVFKSSIVCNGSNVFTLSRNDG